LNIAQEVKAALIETSDELKTTFNSLKSISCRLHRLNPKIYKWTNDATSNLEGLHLGNWYICIPNLPSTITLPSIVALLDSYEIKTIWINQKIKNNESLTFLKIWTDQKTINNLLYTTQVINDQEFRVYLAKRPKWIRSGRNKRYHPKWTLAESNKSVKQMSSDPQGSNHQEAELNKIERRNEDQMLLEQNEISCIGPKQKEQPQDSGKEILNAICGLNWKSYILLKSQSKAINKCVGKLQDYFSKRKDNIKNKEAKQNKDKNAQEKNRIQIEEDKGG